MRKPNFSNLGILADDLTGACDVAACFVPVAGPIIVFVSPEAFADQGRNLAVVNTASRSMTVEDSRAVVRAVGARLTGKRIIFKKICSALRGRVGAELDGLLQAVGPRQVIIAPAIPKIGRTTCDGIQYDCGIPIDRTDYAGDPVSPIRTASIAEIVAETGGVEFQVGDARTDDDLRGIVAAALQSENIVFVGSLGLAEALAQQMEHAAPGVTNVPVPVAERILLVCGSPYPQAQEQIERSVAHYGTRSIILDSIAEANGLREWPPGVVTIMARAPGRFSGQPFPTWPRFINTVAELISRLNPDGLGIIGGETACHLLRQLQVNRLVVYGRRNEVISYGIMADGLLSGRPFTMKGGSVGPQDAAIIMIENLKDGTAPKQ